MSDDSLHTLGRKQRADLEHPSVPPSLEDELSRPFDERERAAILDSVFERVDANSAAPPSSSPAGEPGQVVQLGARRRGPLIGSLLALAAAAALVWWAWPKPTPEQGPVAAAVPAYTFTALDGGIAEQRSDTDLPIDATAPELKLHPDSVIEWVLTPAEPAQGPIGVALLARSEDAVTKFVSPLEAEVSEVGAVRLYGPLSGYVELDPGQWSVVLFVAPPQQLPSDASEASRDHTRWRRLPLRVIIVPEE
ncbi:MAG TPA: hypothetical protein VM869_28205 [Enhygromyxa sp.]|nr:hypothetical protein [Enhygromyxa sp.]